MNNDVLYQILEEDRIEEDYALAYPVDISNCPETSTTACRICPFQVLCELKEENNG